MQKKGVFKYNWRRVCFALAHKFVNKENSYLIQLSTTELIFASGLCNFVCPDYLPFTISILYFC